MAYDARHGFTVQEATNLQVYNDYKMQKETADGSANEYADWTGTPAKQILIYIVAAAGDDVSLEIELKINGSYGDKIYIYSQLEYSNPPVYGNNRTSIDSILNTFYIEYSSDRYNIKLGDLYELYGRGLGFYTLQEQAIDYDNSIKGFALNYSLKRQGNV